MFAIGFIILMEAIQCDTPQELVARVALKLDVLLTLIRSFLSAIGAQVFCPLGWYLFCIAVKCDSSLFMEIKFTKTFDGRLEWRASGI